MTVDIDALRNLAVVHKSFGGMLIKEAIAEIERLRDENRTLTGQLERANKRVDALEDRY